MAIAKKKAPKKEPAEKPQPLRCKCGKLGALVKLKGGWIVSCPDPLNCVGNFLTCRKSTEKAAIEEWNNLIRYGGEK